MSVFAAIDAGRVHAVVAPITVAEVVCGPMKSGNEALAERYRYALCSGVGWSMRGLDADIAMLAARLRIQHHIKLPDAIQLATAIHDGCYALLTYDRDFGDIESIRILGQKPRSKKAKKTKGAKFWLTHLGCEVANGIIASLIVTVRPR